MLNNPNILFQMKNLLSLFLALLITQTMIAQSQRLVLLEELTSSTCGPCAGVNPTFHNWQVQNPTKFTSIYWHVSWPSPGNDPMYLANKAENNARVSFYGVGYVPFSVLDGNYYSGDAGGWNMNNVNARWAMPSPFEISVRHRVSTGNDSVYVTMVARVTQDITAPMTAQNVVIEKHIHFASPPGTNGEKDFYNVMKKMLPGVSGTNLTNTLVVGDYLIFEGAWKFGIIYNPTEIAAVSFIQNKTTKEIYQAANSSTDPLVMPYNNDLQVMSVSNLPMATCLGRISPVINVRNNGNHTITTFQVKYQVNAGDLQTYTWTGSLPTLGRAIINFPEYNFNAQSNNTLRVYTVTPNNLADEYRKNDTLVQAINGGPLTANTLYLSLRTDSLPQQTSWEVKNSLGQVIKSGGPYTEMLHSYRDTIALPVSDCYTFTMFDTGGNGLCCLHGSGGYEMKDSQGVTVATGGTFTFSQTTEFKLEPATGINNGNKSFLLNVYPNPFTNNTNLSFQLDRGDNVSYSLYSIMGEPILTAKLGYLNPGNHEVTIDGSGIRAGIYILKLSSGNLTTTRKLTVIR